MNKFVRSLITEWRKLGLPFAGEKIIIAVSGGADSVSLALALNRLRELKKLKTEFTVAHFNHDLRGEESEKDADFVKDLAERLNFQFVCEKPTLKIQDQKGNLEQIARTARYNFLTKTAVKLEANFVLTAHTLNDQAETFLLNLLRGSGIEGLSAMKTRRSLESGVWSLKSEESLSSVKNKTLNLIDQSRIQNPESKIELVRPFLSWAKREDTEKFCLENDAAFRQDAMNKDLKFSRARIRKELMPVLQTFNPKVVETLAKTSELLRKDAEFLASRNPNEFERLSVKELTEMTEAMRLRCVRDWIKTRRGNLRRIESAHLEAIENLVLSRKSGRVVELPNGEKVIKKNGKLSFEINRVEKRRLAN